MTSSKTPASSHNSNNLRGTFKIAGDKSISHRSLIIGSQLLGNITIHNMLESEDVACTAEALRLSGVKIAKSNIGGGGDIWQVAGVGIGGLRQPENIFDMGNSGTSTRLLAGLFASYPYLCTFTGDASLRKRPMQRIIDPLAQMGVQFLHNEARTLPLAMKGVNPAIPITYALPVASAQVKSAVMLAGLNIAGITTVIEKIPTRDHTERMFDAVGIPVEVVQQEDGDHIKVHGQPSQKYQDRDFYVPADPSSAAFPLVATLITENSEMLLENICLNPTRTGLYVTLKEMGANIEFVNERIVQGEPVADIKVASSKLRGVVVPPERAPSMIDEYPILAMAAANAIGTTTMLGLHELRVKESDRFAAIVEGLRACGVQVDVDGDNMVVHGVAQVQGGGTVATHLDHRIAMSFLVLGITTKQPVMVDDINAINTSFPSFISIMRQAGAKIELTSHIARPLLRRSDDKKLVIAIDGPAASGKGTLAEKLADYFGVAHLDTGSLYRATALRLMAAGGDPENVDDAVKAAGAINVHDLADTRLRNEQVGRVASIVSSIPAVRETLLDFQRNFAGSGAGAVLDGRDIGTVVCPQALVKIFMTASLEARAHRRHLQLQEQGIEVVYESVLHDLRERDKRDTIRNSSPLIAADDAFLIDTTEMNIEEVFTEIVKRTEREIASLIQLQQVTV
jgi:3-phosphoshikimate 1-carboxyvinyltransferase